MPSKASPIDDPEESEDWQILHGKKTRASELMESLELDKLNRR